MSAANRLFPQNPCRFIHGPIGHSERSCRGLSLISSLVAPQAIQNSKPIPESGDSAGFPPWGMRPQSLIQSVATPATPTEPRASVDRRLVLSVPPTNRIPDQFWENGLISATAIGVKSWTLRVTTVRLWQMAVAAIKASR